MVIVILVNLFEGLLPSIIEAASLDAVYLISPLLTKSTQSSLLGSEQIVQSPQAVISPGVVE